MVQLSWGFVRDFIGTKEEADLCKGGRGRSPRAQARPQSAMMTLVLVDPLSLPTCSAAREAEEGRRQRRGRGKGGGRWRKGWRQNRGNKRERKERRRTISGSFHLSSQSYTGRINCAYLITHVLQHLTKWCNDKMMQQHFSCGQTSYVYKSKDRTG